MHFDMENGLAGKLREFQSALSPISAELVDLSQVPSYDWMRHVSIHNSSFMDQQALLNKQRPSKVSLVFNHLEPMLLAKHITYLEHKAIRRITVSFLANVFVYFYLIARA
jgi:RAS guanyl-releasing protein 3